MHWIINSCTAVILSSFFSQMSMAADEPRQCHFDASSAYQAMMKHQASTKKQALHLNINTATASDFTSLSGVGINTAERIVEYRRQVGRFVSVDELMQVKGIGKATLEKNRHRLSVAP
ncbi:ComEA family DNA-binding protein [Moraxella oculi]|uniref:ComEA family DNA-binding protein n=1 Tax=Moraxella oculi TaxID=2940516 RepID=A0ABW8U6G1_9GAMM